MEGQYISLQQVKEELNYPDSTTNFDVQLTHLILLADQYFNMRMQRYTSLPVNSDIAAQVAEFQIRWVGFRFRQRNSNTNQYAELTGYLNEVEKEFQDFLTHNFKTTFESVGSQDNRIPYNNPLGRPIPFWSTDGDYGGNYY